MGDIDMNWVIILTGIIFLLYIARTIFIPLLIAAFLWYLMNAISDYYRRALPCRESCTSRITSFIFDWVSYIGTIATITLIGYLFATQIRPMFSELAAALPALQTKLTELGAYLSGTIGLRFDANLLPNITQVAANIGSSVAGIAASMGMIVVYMIFMFVEQSTFNRKFNAMFPNKRQSKKLRYILDSVDSNMKKYLFIKTAISIVTGVASFIWLYAIDVEFAGVWAFIVFIANYIPTIGAIIACGLPILYTLITCPTLQLPILTAAGLIGIQILLGNIIEPKLTGKTLNLSTLAILINLVVWGMIWGIAGMFFSVPILVGIYIVAAQFDSTRWIAVLLSADGNIPDKNED